MTRYNEVKSAAWFGLLMGAFMSGVVLLMVRLRGLDYLHRQGLTLLPVISVYLVGGIAAGAIIGLLLPVIRSGLSAVLVGIVAALPVALGIYTVQLGPLWTWNRTAWISTGLLSVIFGAMGAQVFYKPPRKRGNSGPG